MSYKITEVRDGLVELNSDSGKVFLHPIIVDLLTSVNEFTQTLVLANAITEKVEVSQKTAINILESVTFGYKNYRGVSLLEREMVEGRRVFKSVSKRKAKKTKAEDVTVELHPQL
jgi:hypothetical protein